MRRYLWNGRFFIHQLHLGHEGLDSLEGERLSLSNTYDINRGLTSLDESRSIVEEYMAKISAETGRQYHLFNYYGAADAENVIVAMGSVSETVMETVDYINKNGGRQAFYRYIFTDLSLQSILLTHFPKLSRK